MFGSGPLAVRGLIAAPSDLDVICRGKAWEAALTMGPPVRLPDLDVEVVSLFDGAVTLGATWAIGSFDIDLLIDTAETIDGLPFVRLEHVAAYKRLSDRPKDRRHLASLATYQDDGAPRPGLDGPDLPGGRGTRLAR